MVILFLIRVLVCPEVHYIIGIALLEINVGCSITVQSSSIKCCYTCDSRLNNFKRSTACAPLNQSIDFILPTAQYFCLFKHVNLIYCLLCILSLFLASELSGAQIHHLLWRRKSCQSSFSIGFTWSFKYC